MLRNALALMTIATLATLAACATTTPDATGGWRKAVVVQVGDADSFGPPTDNDCRAQARPGEQARRYVEVRYFVGRHAHLRIVPIDAALRVAADDTIWFRSIGCVDARLAAPDR